MPPALGLWDSLESPCGTASSDGSRTSRTSEGLGSLRGSTTWSLQDGTAGQGVGCYPTTESPPPLLHLTISPLPSYPPFLLKHSLGCPDPHPEPAV